MLQSDKKIVSLQLYSNGADLDLTACRIGM